MEIYILPCMRLVIATLIVVSLTIGLQYILYCISMACNESPNVLHYLWLYSILQLGCGLTRRPLGNVLEVGQLSFASWRNTLSLPLHVRR